MSEQYQGYQNGGGGYSEEEHLQRKQQELLDLENEEVELEQWIKELQGELQDMARDPVYAEFAYLTFDDIKTVSQG